ncbi:MAG: hypothetical protein ACOY5B_13580 [Spirochaetota bacterium]
MNFARIIMGMSCREFSEHTSATHDHPAGLWVRLRMAWHHLLCVYCRRLARQWLSIRETLRREPPAVTMPDPLKEKIRRNLGAGD